MPILVEGDLLLVGVVAAREILRFADGAVDLRAPGPEADELGPRLVGLPRLEQLLDPALPLPGVDLELLHLPRDRSDLLPGLRQTRGLLLLRLRRLGRRDHHLLLALRASFGDVFQRPLCRGHAALEPLDRVDPFVQVTVDLIPDVRCATEGASESTVLPEKVRAPAGEPGRPFQRALDPPQRVLDALHLLERPLGDRAAERVAQDPLQLFLPLLDQPAELRLRRRATPIRDRGHAPQDPADLLGSVARLSPGAGGSVLQARQLGIQLGEVDVQFAGQVPLQPPLRPLAD